MGDVAIGFCLDQSGSMEVQVKEAVAGFNAFKEEQVNQPGSAYLTLVLFDTAPVVRFAGGDMKLVPDLGQGVNPYTPSGGTALYDAVDTTITEVEQWINQSSYSDRVIIAVFTDGAENSSQRVSIDALNERIRAKKEEGWDFVFLGSGGASWTEGRTFAAAGMNTLNYSGKAGSTQTAYAAMSSSITQTRTGGQSLGSTFTNSTAGLQADPNLIVVEPEQTLGAMPPPGVEAGMTAAEVEAALDEPEQTS
jgi:hypothetical protein